MWSTTSGAAAAAAAAKAGSGHCPGSSNGQPPWSLGLQPVSASTATRAGSRPTEGNRTPLPATPSERSNG